MFDPPPPWAASTPTSFTELTMAATRNDSLGDRIGSTLAGMSLDFCLGMLKGR